MHRTTINIAELVYQQARIKALREDVSISEVIRRLLARWVAGEIALTSGDRSREKLVRLARSARGMWANRDPDAYLAASRASMKARDEDLAHARLDA